MFTQSLIAQYSLNTRCILIRQSVCIARLCEVVQIAMLVQQETANIN